MKTNDYFSMEMLCRLTRVTIMIYEKEHEVFRPDYLKNSPIVVDTGFNIELIHAAKKQQIPLIIEDEEGILFACFVKDDFGLVMGPVTFERLDVVRLHHFFSKHHNKPEAEKQLLKMDVSEFFSMVSFLAKEVTGCEYETKELVQANHLKQQENTDEKAKLLQQMSAEENESAHHTYQEEQQLLEFVRSGKVKEAIDMTMRLDSELGIMSLNELKQWRRTAVVGITLCSRAAIEGGVTPAQAYRVSDESLQKLDRCKDVPRILNCRNKAITDLCKLVEAHKNRTRFSSHVEIARAYVEKHYREKIYLDEIAEAIGVSPTYLSRLFSKEMNIRLQDYIVKIRVERAANLLKFSDMSITEISKYVNFPSGGYFGQVFKKYMGMTPKEYRNEYKPREFT